MNNQTSGEDSKPMKQFKRKYFCGEITESLIDRSKETEVTLYGWVHRRRDHGGVIFIDLRDRKGWVQVVFYPEDEEHPQNKRNFTIAEKLRSEYVIKVSGRVRHRPEGTVNMELPTGHVEVLAEDIEILNESSPLPFRIDEHQEIGENVRLKYRYLDLRRPEMTARIVLRSTLNQLIRDYLSAHDFLEIETPFLTKSTPEGARDYLVPSRIYPGEFYALPQSPQIFKQLLMIAGMDRYYQIVRCFRDEDLRADRQPEFTQLDLEMTFVDERQVQDLVEEMIRQLFQKLMDVALPNPFPRITYKEAVSRYGTDRPDLRILLELVDVGDLLKKVEFNVFSGPANDSESRVVAMCVREAANLTRKEIDDYTTFVKKYGAKGLAYIKVNDLSQGMEGLQSPILKFLPEDIVNALLERVDAKEGSIIFFGADKTKIVNESMGALRVKIGGALKGPCSSESNWHPLWVVDFPMFEWDEKEKRWQALHHPFTAPQTSDPEALLKNPGSTLSRAYDMVLNGSEIGGGSIRINKLNMQKTVFEILGISQEEADVRFNHLLTALEYGAPPHGGIAFGLDRIAMLLSNAKSLREVIVFPKTQTAQCPLTNAPTPVSSGQLRELGLKVIKKIVKEVV